MEEMPRQGMGRGWRFHALTGQVIPARHLSDFIHPAVF